MTITPRRGDDEPEIDPLSNKAWSAQDLTSTVVLPTDGRVQVDSVRPTFWIGGTASDPNSLFNQAFLELQFYPNSITTGSNHGTPFCYYPWYAFNATDRAFMYSGDHPGTTKDFGQALEFQQQENCVSPSGPFPQYCSTTCTDVGRRR